MFTKFLRQLSKFESTIRVKGCKVKTDIQRLEYEPQASYQLDLEVFSITDLRHRGKEQVRKTHRYEFHTLVCVTHGKCTQMVDFKSISCEPGSLLVLRAGQAHNYGQDEDWDGWNILFRPEFVLPTSTTFTTTTSSISSTTSQDLKLALDLERLHEHMVLSPQELSTVTGLIQQMREDTLIDASQEEVNALLRHQLHSLLARLSILQGRRQAQESLISPAMQRFRRFQQLVEKNFTRWHQVADYASRLGYTEKTLARAVMASMDMSAKVFIAARIVLEAKRLLAHTDLSVVAIAEKLGFDEPTNFSKFFKREAECTPAEFRRRQKAGNLSS